MNGDADLPHRSSSPLKRRASSMDPENEADKGRDVEMGTTQATNGEQDIQSAITSFPRAMSVDAPEPNASTSGTASQPTPSLLEQVKIIETLLKAFADAPLKEGTEAYLVSRSWVGRALALRGDPKNAKKDLPTGPLGPVDNSDIIEETIKDANGTDYVRLKAGYGLEEFELFPEDAWKMVIDWYGIKEGQQAIIRRAINTADAQSEPNIMYEFYPCLFRVHRLWSEVSPLPIEQALKAKNPPAPVVVRSRMYHAQNFIKELKTYTGVPPDRKVRLWTIPQTLPAGGAPSQPRSALTPPDSPGNNGSSSNPQDAWNKLLLDVASFGEVQDNRIKVPAVDRTTDENYNGKASLQIYDLVTDQTIILDEEIEQWWVSTYTGRSRGNDKGIPTRGNALAPASAPVSGRSSPGPLTRGRAQKKGRTIGAVGLQNLGNTCYMNSALQCVRSVKELTTYFLTGAYSDEINKTNALGYNGKIAITYGNLLKEIYMEGKGSVSPRDFKTTVGRCRSTFSGWGQQDSQEFLGFLLDGLQEDLSRIKKKPYIEKPDSTDEMVNDPAAIKEMADKVWDITRKRDDSVIADLFTGMYKSTLKCPECGKISITFDPFNNLTLPLPVEDLWTGTVKFFPLNDVPVKIEVELPKHSAIEQLMQFMSVRTGVPADRIIGGEEYKDKFFKIYDGAQDVSEEIGANDIPTFHELEAVPTNWPGKAKPKRYRSMLDIETPLDASEWDDPRYERMVVPVFHRRQSSGYGRAEGTSPPHFIVLTREEASRIDIIRRKVLAKVATFSTWSKLRDANEVDSVDPEMVMTSVSDADSSGDSKVQAQSVEGEDDMVDVTMKDGDDQSRLPHQPGILKQFNTRPPKYTNPDGFLDPELQNLFDLSYFLEHDNGDIASGWQKLEQRLDFPKLSDRIPEQSIEEDDEASPESWNSTGSGNEEDSPNNSNDESLKAEESQTRMMSESSDDDLPHPSKLAVKAQKGPSGGRKKFNGRKTYSKKGAKRREKQARNKQSQRAAAVRAQPMPPAIADGGPLIRLGEGLIVEWNKEAWEQVFGGSARDPEEDQGTKTFTNLERLSDPALKISQRRRLHRRTRGITLEECLDEFERAEILSEQDMWYCPRCKEHRRASKKFDLWKTPDILVAHLKRFSSSGWRRDKLDVLVDFPIEGLDLTTRVIQKDEGKAEIYDLIAVDDHYGGLGGGHYTAYAKNFVDGKWYNYNDSSVSQVSDPSSAITSAAYLLFYRRRSSGPLGGSRFAEISEKYDASEDEEFTESGEDQRLGGGSSLVGSSSAGIGAVATRHQADRGSGRTTVTALAGSDDEDNHLPPYEAASQVETIHNSIEDEGIEMADGYQPLRAKSINMTQGWSFNALGGNGAEDSAGGDIASDDAQPDSSADERALSQNVFDSDTEMPGLEDTHPEPPAADESAQLALADIQRNSWGRKQVISVPQDGDSDRGSNEVTEIHLEDKP